MYRLLFTEIINLSKGLSYREEKVKILTTKKKVEHKTKICILFSGIIPVQLKL